MNRSTLASAAWAAVALGSAGTVALGQIAATKPDPPFRPSSDTLYQAAHRQKGASARKHPDKKHPDKRAVPKVRSAAKAAAPIKGFTAPVGLGRPGDYARSRSVFGLSNGGHGSAFGLSSGGHGSAFGLSNGGRGSAFGPSGGVIGTIGSGFTGGSAGSGSAFTRGPAGFGGGAPGSLAQALAQAGGPPSVLYSVGQQYDPFGKAGGLGEVGAHRVSLETDHAEPMEAIINLMRSAGANYIIGGDGIGGRRITARFQNVTLAEALDALAEAAGLEYHTRGNIIILTSPYDVFSGAPDHAGLTVSPFPGVIGSPSTKPAPPASATGGATVPPPSGEPNLPMGLSDGNPSPPAPPAAGPGAGAESTGTGAESSSNASRPRPDADQVAIINLLHRDVREVVDLIPPRLPQLAAVTFLKPDTRENALVVSGPPDAIRQVQEIVRLLDAPPAAIQMKFHVFQKAGSLPVTWFAAPVHLRSAGTFRVVVVPGVDSVDSLVRKVMAAGGKLASSPMISTLDGKLAELRIDRAPARKGKLDMPIAAARAALADERIAVRPRLDRDGTIMVEGSFLLRRGPAEAGEAGTGKDAPAKPARLLLQDKFARRIGPHDVLAFLGPPSGREAGGGVLLLLSAVPQTDEPQDARFVAPAASISPTKAQ